MDSYKKALEASFAPLVELILAKKVKKKKDIHALSMKPPMGMRPDNVTPEVGTKFVKEFLPIAWEAVKEKSKKKTMKNLRILLQESKDEGKFNVVAVSKNSAASQSEQKKVPQSQATSPPPVASSTVPEKHLKEMMNKGFSQHSSEMWYSAFEMLDTNGKEKIDVSSLSTFFSQFGETLEQDEAEFILSKLRRSRGEKTEAKDKESSVGLVDFATYMNAKMKTSPSEIASYHQPRFGAAFDLFTQNGSMMTSTHVQNAMATLQEPVTMEEATEMAAETPEKQKFINVLNGHVMNEVQQLGEASMGGPPSGEDVTEEMKEAWQKAKKLLKFMAPKLKISHMLKSKGWKDEQIENLLGPLDEIK